MNGNYTKCNMLRNKMNYAISDYVSYNQEGHAGNNGYHLPG
jgi:hypothetical protein